MMLSYEVIAVLMLVAFAAGFIDAIAGGGGLLTIPALMAAGVPPVYAIATNKLQSTFGTGGAVWAFARAGHIDFRRFALPVALTFIGSALGAYLLQQIDPSFLSALIPFLLIAMALYFLLAPKMSDEDRHSRLGPVGMAVAVAVIGCYDGFFGPGAGSFFITILVALCGFGMVRAVAHSKLLNFTSNLAALAAMIIGGKVLWVVGLAMAVANIAGNQVGARTAMRFGSGMVRPLLVIMSLALTIKLLSDPANPIRVYLAS